MALLDVVKNKSSFLKDDNEQLHFADLYQESIIMSSHLQEVYKLNKNSKIILCATNSIAFVKAMFASSGLGAELYLMNPNQKQLYVASFISKKKIDLIIGDSSNKEMFETLDIPFFNCEETMISIPKKVNIIRTNSSIVILSSGSKGIPKEEKRKMAVLNFINPLLDIVKKLELIKNNAVLISVPLFHGYGLASILLSIFLEQNITLMQKYDTLKTVNILNTKAIDCWVAVPMMVQKVLDTNQLKQYMLKRCISGGDLLPYRTIQKIDSITKIYNLYGTSESGVCSIASHNDLLKYEGTIGQMINGVQSKIIDLNGNEMEEGIGELYVHCKWVSDARSQNFVATGDLVSKNADGFYFYKGRKDDMIVIGGENIYPIEIESVIYKYPSINWVRVNSFIDEYQYIRIQASLVLKKGIFFSEIAFKEWLNSQLPAYCIPRKIELLDEIESVKLM
jgi:fatty-acyl-CoA synthase